MKQLLLLPLLFLMPAAANAESVWLLVSRTMTGMEKIEMRDMDQCNEVRAHWEKTTRKKFDTFSICLRGK